MELAIFNSGWTLPETLFFQLYFESGAGLAVILLKQNYLKIREIPLKPGINTIGRAKTQTISIEDDNVTRHHAEITADISKRIFVYEDLHSLNGSFLNRKKIDKHLLQDGDVIHVGIHQLHFMSARP